MRILFMGTPDFAAVSLRHLISANLDVIGVVTQPDRPKGRGLELTPSEVKQVATEYHLPVWQPEQVAAESFREIFRSLAPDMVVVVAFGQKIPQWILDEPRYGCINVHGSLLPRYRGAAPIQWSLLNGDPETGVTTMYMDEGWDTGDMIFQESLPIDPNENFGGLYPKMAELGGQLLIKTVHAIMNGEAPRMAQDHSRATKAPKIKSEMQAISWSESAKKIHNQVRGLSPFPGAETFYQSERLKILETKLIPDDKPNGQPNNQPPGTVMKIIKNEGIAVSTGEGLIEIIRLQPQGKKAMSAGDFANGRRLAPGMHFGTAPSILNSI